ncbi:MAG: PAS domain S-box protein [Deltaproteobacteria bacterium]|nr:PAS domain S-box protein [Deltaproteobacteria bacterium]MBW2070961.1 PAS domain S-box protein [Deltaproteobacteria bacterium]
MTRANLRLTKIFLAVLILLSFIFSGLLFTGMLSTKKRLERLSSSQAISSALVEDLRDHYQLQWSLDMVLITLSLSMGLTLILIYRYLLRVASTLREVQTIERDILNSITRGIVTVDLQGQITSCNRALEEILGVQAAALVGHPLEELFAPDDPLYKFLDEAIRQEEAAHDTDVDYTTSSGSAVCLRVTTFGLKNEKGQKVGAILLLKDMTALRKMEERMQRASRLAALGELMQRLVHEIRNPLSAMDINLQLLEERLEAAGTKDEVERYLKIISSETRRLNEVLSKAQTFAQPHGAVLEVVDLHEVLQQVVSLLRAEAERKGIKIEANLAAAESLLRADRDQLEQVFINLFKNSIEAMANGGRLEVTSRNSVRGGTIEIEIVDTGSGIPMGDLQRIFDPYYTTKKKGTGLGLSIVHSIINQHGGTVDVGSWLGEGTLFHLSLPLLPSNEENGGKRQTDNTHRG